MKDFYIDYLFNKHILVGKENSDSFVNLVYLAKVYNIKITKGKNLVTKENIAFVSEKLGMNIPEPFYKSFPESVKNLTSLELLADQIIHYYNTYGCNNFEGDSSHSIFEKEIEPKLFNEHTKPKEFVVVDEQAGFEKAVEIYQNLAASTRPANATDVQYLADFVFDQIVRTDRWLKEHKDLTPEQIEEQNGSSYNLSLRARIKDIQCKDTQLRVMLILRDKEEEIRKILKDIEIRDFTEWFSDSFTILDIFKLLKIWNLDPKHLHMSHKQKDTVYEFLCHLDSTKFFETKEIIKEKQQDLKGLIHHVHYHNFNLDWLFDSKCKIRSVMSDFEAIMKWSPVKAAKALLEKKGNGALLRNLNYILSRCNKKWQVQKIADMIQVKNPIILIQLLINYRHYDDSKPRTFTFTNNQLQKVHIETKEEFESRKSKIDKALLDIIIDVLDKKLNDCLKAGNKEIKVYIDPKMDNIALPLESATSNSGLNVLPKGSIVELPKNKIIRLFTYWEKVNDIDLSSIGINKDGTTEEFSWRTFYDKQSKAICFSGDVTNGYNGGSEYIDINIEEFKKQYSNMKYLVCCDNVFSGTGFDNCICKAGFMERSKIASGEIFEPKTVQTSFGITGATNFNLMFAVDLENYKLIWLNTNLVNRSIIAGCNDLNFVSKYFDITKYFSMKKFFERFATEIVSDPKDANIIIDDKHHKLVEGQEQIHSWDFEKIFGFFKEEKKENKETEQE